MITPYLQESINIEQDVTTESQETIEGLFEQSLDKSINQPMKSSGVFGEEIVLLGIDHGM